jgi:hypothetical protein
VNDAGILALALCWVMGSFDQQLRWARRAVLFLLLLMMAPGQSILTRLQPHLSLEVTQSWWWDLVIALYFVWVLFALSMVLLYAVVISGRDALPQVAATPTTEPRFAPYSGFEKESRLRSRQNVFLDNPYI